jgi:hypothetical protein
MLWQQAPNITSRASFGQRRQQSHLETAVTSNDLPGGLEAAWHGILFKLLFCLQRMRADNLSQAR